ncbi:uncharacterized protein LOC144051810 [Vanacampus margaritifer]
MAAEEQTETNVRSRWTLEQFEVGPLVQAAAAQTLHEGLVQEPPSTQETPVQQFKGQARRNSGEQSLQRPPLTHLNASSSSSSCTWLKVMPAFQLGHLVECGASWPLRYSVARPERRTTLSAQVGGDGVLTSLPMTSILCCTCGTH